MASLDDVVSNLKNVVTNLSGLATGTSLVNSIGTLTVAINAISSTLATSLATVHVFGGNFMLVAGGGLTTTAVSEPRAAANAAIAFSAANLAAASTLVDQFVWVNDITASVGFTILADGTATGAEKFYYVGYNP